MERKGIKTTTYSLDWDTVMNLESRLLRDFQTNKTKDRARALLMISQTSRKNNKGPTI